MSKILATIPRPVEGTWQTSMKRAIRSSTALCGVLEIDPRLACPAAEADFPVFAPLEFVQKMEIGNSRDPLFLQVTAGLEELSDENRAHSTRDAVGDKAAERSPGLLQKYDRRVLMIATGACAVHCRYCFRRHYPYSAVPPGRQAWENSMDLIAADESLDEVILSGGDPLTLADESLAWLIDRIASIRHIRRVRIHTRVPVVIPGRICAALLDWVVRCRLPLYFVLHFNHVHEIDAATRTALAELRRAGATLLNQSVLLAGVNDSFEAQRELCLALVDHQVLPYYLHQLDLVQGALHFQVSDARARQLHAQLQAHLPGYAVPKLVREEPGCRSKTSLA